MARKQADLDRIVWLSTCSLPWGPKASSILALIQNLVFAHVLPTTFQLYSLDFGDEFLRAIATI